MSETYRFVISVIGDPSVVSETTWEDHKEAEEEGRKWAEQNPSLIGKEYEVWADLVITED